MAQIWLVPLKIVFNFSRFKPALNWNQFLSDLSCCSNSLSSDTFSFSVTTGYLVSMLFFICRSWRREDTKTGVQNCKTGFYREHPGNQTKPNQYNLKAYNTICFSTLKTEYLRVSWCLLVCLEVIKFLQEGPWVLILPGLWIPGGPATKHILVP